ncbi:hypothetical protein C9I28_17250 [Pseudoduganella armeniaca]|uniref:Uncharacterized protein n=1 Tax=Pseudoduganella armeniaca TaxID=2072590 RepID=A0A2R4CCA7_9BURK|nr:hypothetical protein C9I28_17250 [Pseudoduganella armeniaca]
MDAAFVAVREGKPERALPLLVDVLAQVDSDPGNDLGSEFIVLFAWTQLAASHAPARAALVAARDDQAARLLAGDDVFGPRTVPFPRSRFMIVAQIDERLGSLRATYELFLEMLRRQPALARRHAHRALPAIVAAADFALAERYLPEPLALLAELNELATRLPLYPGDREAPRLAAELSNYVADVCLRAAILDGLGRSDEASKGRHAALAGIASDELRRLALRESRAPGTITRAVSEHRSTLDTMLPGPAPRL